MTPRLALLGACLLLPACASTTEGQPGAIAELTPTDGSTVTGHVEFIQKGDLVLVEAKVSGLSPNSTHGFHIHETGDCSAPDASSAGGHFDPTASPHGGPTDEIRHGGDLGNLKANANGTATSSVKVGGITIDGGPDRILGRAVVVHAGADDFKTQPAGNSGRRVACGVINPTPEHSS
ncbi:MAG TPA: superoxide dismutase family protein [Burkholderiales bacterium]|jgi:superoxide dismutase, Cu-Zn family|nr:superoxide dismutase family protein [Burkholderiales bacterium]